MSERITLRVLLVHPECQASELGYRLAAMPEPLALEMVAASIPDHDLRILDMRVDPDLEGALRSFAPDVVAVTSLTTEVYAAQSVLREVKEHAPEIFTLAGGHHVSLVPEDFYLSCVDALALGEGELVMPHLMEALARDRRLDEVPNLIWQDADGHFVQNPRCQGALEMDRLSVPRRDLVAAHRDEYFWLFSRPDAAMVTSRGCPYRCSFCSIWELYGGRTRHVSPRRVVSEIAGIQEDHITFMDDNFLLNHRRENAIADLILSEGIQKGYGMECRTDAVVAHPELVEKWARIGMNLVLMGMEGTSDEALERFNKRSTVRTNDEAVRIMHDNGIMVWGAFIVDPRWEEEDFRRLREYVDGLGLTHAQFSVLTPLPGTELHRQRYQDLLTHDYRAFDTLHAVTETRLPRERFYQLLAGLYRQSDWGPYYDLLRADKLTVEQCRRGKQMIDIMCNWELYVTGDPVLGHLQAPVPPGGQPAS